MRREIPIFISFVVGVFMMLEIFFPLEPVRFFKEYITQTGMALGAATAVLGMLNIALVNYQKMVRREDSAYKVVLLVSLLITMILGFVWGRGDGTPLSWVYNTFYMPLSATMFSLLAFFIASAAFRAFRARNTEATLLLVAAVIIMIGRVPVGELLSAFPRFLGWESFSMNNFADWIMNFPNMAGKRAILIGAALGAISTGLRVVLGIEKSYLGGE